MKKMIFGLLASLMFCGMMLAGDNAPAGETDWTVKKFGATLLNASGKEFKTGEALKGRMVAVYFSASWCPPCRAFTPKLVSFYRKAARKNDFAIVLVGCDKTAEAMKDYMKKYSMPWYAVPFDAPEAAAVKQELRVRGIPSLAVYDAEGKLRSGSARWDVMVLGEKAVAAWQSEKYQPKTAEDYKQSLTGKSRRKRK